MNNMPADKNRRVLVIDDNRAIHDDFRKILSPATVTAAALDAVKTAVLGPSAETVPETQFEVDAAYQGQEGVLLVKKALETGRPYAMAFVDVRMPPGMDGVETIRMIWELDPNVQIVLCTAYSDLSWDEIFEKLGHRDGLLILKKPFDVVEAFQLAHALTEKWWLHLQSRRKMEELESLVADRTGELQQSNHALQAEVVERKQAEEALRQAHDELEKRVAERTAELSQERRLLRTLIDNLPDGIYAKDAAGRKIMANPADLKVLGCRTEAGAIGKSDFDLFPKDMAEKFWADDQRVIRGEPVINREEFVLDEQGRKSWLLTSKLPLRDQDGKIVGLVGIGRNITGQKQAEESLRQSRDELEKRVAERTAELAGANATLQQQIAERKRIEQVLDRERLLLRTLIDNLPDAIYAKDTAGQKTMANPADLKNLRCQTEADAVGKSDFDLFPKEVAEQFWADDQKVIQGEPVINREEHFFDEAGQKHWLLTSKLPLRDLTGKIVGLVGIGHDITERKQAEDTIARERQLLRTLIDRLPETFYIKDLDSRFLVANEAQARQCGKGTPSQMLGLSDADLFPAELAAEFRAEELKVFAGEPLIDHENTVVFPDGREHTVLTTKLPFRDSEGRICGLVGIGHDITERKRADEALRKSSKELQERNDELTRFTYTASHDLKSPLVTIRVFLGYLEQDTRNQDVEAVKKDRGYIYTAVDKMTRLLDELLKLARVGSKMNPPEEVPLQTVVKDALDMVAGAIIQQGVEVVATKEPIMLYGDRTRLVEVFQNLADNAIKFMGDQPTPRVEIGVEKAGEENVFFVRDNGMGIDPRYQPKVFGLFEKYDPGTKGSGIGLALVKRIVEVHGGKIWVESAGIGKGTTFRFTLAKIQPHSARL
jgi:PAS domain S-box-containing protein